jgi:hypothetical protein
MSLENPTGRNRAGETQASNNHSEGVPRENPR